MPQLILGYELFTVGVRLLVCNRKPGRSGGRGARAFGASSTRLTDFSAPTRRRTTTVKTSSPEIVKEMEMGNGPPERHPLGGTSTQSTTCYAFPLDDKRRWRPHWWPYPGRRTLPHCKNGASSWGCCAASPLPSPDKGACSNGCNMPSKDRQGGTSNSQQTCTVSWRPGANYSTAWPAGPPTPASYNLLSPHGLVLPMNQGLEWEGYAKTQMVVVST